MRRYRLWRDKGFAHLKRSAVGLEITALEAIPDRFKGYRSILCTLTV